jgi:pimeloyl-ACP methyl ester carboxylesterase
VLLHGQPGSGADWQQIGHHLPRRGAAQIAAAIVDFLAALDTRPASA